MTGVSKLLSDATAKRRAATAPGPPVGVTEAMIAEVVHAFYSRVRSDPSIGPIFLRVNDDDWPNHLARICDFWSSVLLMSGRFKGSPMAVHIGIIELCPVHFVRWLKLFQQTVTDLCPEAAAALFVEKAEMIARSLQLGIAAQNGDLLSPVQELSNELNICGANLPKRQGPT